MKYLTPAILAATLALSAGAAFATDPPSTEATSASKQAWKDCMAAQEAKNSGASQADMKKACKEMQSNSTSSGAVDSHPYGSAPPSSTSPSAPPPR